MTYTPLFDAAHLEELRPRRPGAISYLYEPGLELAINVALAAGRPLLLKGLPGTGKSTLAEDVAWKLERRFLEEVVTSRTRAQDLQWTFDAVRRLSDASGPGGVKSDEHYVRPGVLWRAFVGGDSAVVLLDEIDKAEPDVPNDLLVALDARWFEVTETRERVEAPRDLAMLLVITTNDERALPPAFVRRCIVYEIQAPSRDRLTAIARRHVPELDAALLDQVYELYGALVTDARAQKLREPSTAELLDALRACRQLGITDASSPAWADVCRRAMWKHR
jgi:MoxR-like ATPase